MLEKDFMQRIIDLARLRGFMVFHPFNSRRSTPGFPDLTITGRGRLIFMEVKADNGRVSVAQQEWVDALTAAGAVAMIVRPCDWPLIVKVLT